MKLSLSWTKGRLGYSFRVARKGQEFPADLEQVLSSPEGPAGTYLDWSIRLLPSAPNKKSGKETIGILELGIFKRLSDKEGHTIGFEAAGSSDCSVNIIPQVKDWSTTGPNYVAAGNARNTFALSELSRNYPLHLLRAKDRICRKCGSKNFKVVGLGPPPGYYGAAYLSVKCRRCGNSWMTAH